MEAVQPNENQKSLPEDENPVSSPGEDELLDKLGTGSYIEPDVKSESLPEDKTSEPKSEAKGEKIGFDDPRHPDHPRFRQLQDQIRVEREQAKKIADEALYWREKAVQSIPQQKPEPPQIETMDDLEKWISQTVETRVNERVNPVVMENQKTRIEIAEEKARMKYKDYDQVINKMLSEDQQTVLLLLQAGENSPELVYRVGKSKDLDTLINEAEARGKQNVTTIRKEKSRTVVGAVSRPTESNPQADRIKVAKAVQSGKLKESAILDLLQGHPSYLEGE